jgi:hypothetical protein
MGLVSFSSIHSEYESAIDLEQHWRSLLNTFDHVNKISYDVTLSKSSSPSQWNGLKLLGLSGDGAFAEWPCSTSSDYLTLSSLVKSASVQGTSISYVNYGRAEDFAYLMEQNAVEWQDRTRTIVFMRRRETIITQTEQIRQAIRHRYAGLVLFDDDDDDDAQPSLSDRRANSQSNKGKCSTCRPNDMI